MAHSKSQLPPIPNFIISQGNQNFSVRNSAKLFFAMSKGAGLLPAPFLSNLNKLIMKNFILFLSLFAFLTINTESKAQPYYYNSGIPTLFESWGNLPSGSGAHPSSFGENTQYIIESGKTAVMDFQWFVDGSAALRINSGGIVQINNTINIGPNATLILDSGSTLIYNSTNSAQTTIFGGTENFDKKSNFVIKNWSGLNDPLRTGMNTTGPVYAPYYFGNLEIDWEGCNGNWRINYNIGNFFPICANDLKVTGTGKGKIIWPILNHPTNTILATNNFIQTGGEIDFSFGSALSNNYAGILRLFGNFQKTGGIMDANGSNSFGMIEFVKDTNYVSRDSTEFRTFSSTGTFRNTAVSLDKSRVKLLSNLSLPFANNYANLQIAQSKFDCSTFKVTGFGNVLMYKSTIMLRSPDGFKNGASNGNITTVGAKIFNDDVILEYCGNVPQVTGDSLPDIMQSSVTINNPEGVTLSKPLGIHHSVTIYPTLNFVKGKLNLGNHNLVVQHAYSVTGANQNSFINTNGAGFYKTFVFSYDALPIGNGTYSPAFLNEVLGADTIWSKVENTASVLPFDTSRCARKFWRIFQAVPTGMQFYVALHFMKTDMGSNMTAVSSGNRGSIGKYSSWYNGYVPARSFYTTPFVQSVDTSVMATIVSGSRIDSTSESKILVAANDEGIYETYYPNSSADAADLNTWATQPGGVHPPSFDRYSLFVVPPGGSATFNSSASFTNKTILRANGDGVINGNAPVFVGGGFQLRDSATFNFNNTTPLYQTYFMTYDVSLSTNSTCKILKWSDTSDKIFNFSPYVFFGNLVINFDNLPNSLGGNWTTFKYSDNGYVGNPVTGNLIYIQSSGYDFCPVGFGNRVKNVRFEGNVQIGDSVNYPNANPTLNLSGGTTMGTDTTAGSLYIGKNLDIQRGRVTCQDFPAVARGRIVFSSSGFYGPGNLHTFYCYNPFLWQTYNLGNTKFPNLVASPDTLILKSDMYNSQSAPFLMTDVWQVDSAAVLNIDTFKIRSINLKVKNYGKLITKNRDGFYADLATQTVTFDPNSLLEYAGNVPQNLQKSGVYNLTSFPNLMINNPTGVTVNMPNISITNSVTFITGKLISDNTNYLTFPDAAQFIGASNSSFLSGPVRMNTTSTGIKTIPTGKGSIYRAVVIIPSSSSSTDWIVEYFNQQQAFGNTLGAGLTSVSTAEYYLINRSGSANATVGLVWGVNSGVTHPENLRVARWNDFQWEDKGNSGFLGDPSGGIVFSNMISNFSPFAIASTDNQKLPVELSSFNSSSDKNSVTLNWVTETEINNSGFDIERKSDADSIWKKINFIQGAGNSNSSKSYKYEDRNLAMGKYKYRLKQIDYNGNFTYYNLQNEISVGIPAKFNISQNYPNPFNPSTKINFEIPKETKVSIQLYDMTGRLVGTLVNNESYQPGYYTVQFNGTELASGTYFYRIIAGDFIATKKMQLIK